MEITQFKKYVLKIAKNDKDLKKLSRKERKRVYDYISLTRDTFDLEFTGELLKLSPNYLRDKREKEPGVEARKQEMLEYAALGISRKEYFKQKGNTGYSYLRKSSFSYDEQFASKLYAINPAWGSKYQINKNKQMLIDMAKSKQDKPACGTKLRSILNNYTTPGYLCYDKKLVKTLNKLNKNWELKIVTY